jgi:chromosomal replication initiator protein
MVQSVRISEASLEMKAQNFAPVRSEVTQPENQLLTMKPNLKDDLFSARSLWSSALPRLRSELGSDTYKAWIEPLRLCAIDGKSVTLGAPNTYAVSRLQTDYLHRLQARWSSLDLLGRRIRLVVAEPTLQDDPPVDTAQDDDVSLLDTVADPIELGATARTFGNFEVGEANRVAVALAKRVAEEPSNGDVVYFHGLHGAGKTHLLEAIAHHLRENAPRRKVLMLTAQRFLNEFQTALRERDTAPFKAALRSTDVLLIDDLQLICGKTATQDEFFQTLGDLVSRGRTVVCSADVPIETLEGLNSRMRCILQGGFTARINEPDFALRRAIAARKVSELNSRSNGFSLEADALDMIAARVIGTGRAIEGTIKQVFAASALIGREADMEVVVEALSDGWKVPEKSVPVETIKRRVAAYFDLSLDDLVSQRRHRAVARPRQIAMYFCKRLTRRSFPDIGQRFGGRDHTTVMHAVKRVEELALTDAAFAAELVEVGRKITE